MIRTGLVSVTFRNLAPDEVIRLVKRAGLEGIEWGGDVHVPHGNLQRAREVGAATRDAGLCVASYGSYYRVGHDEDLAFEAVLETASALGAPSVRVWAGKLGSAQVDAAYRRLIVRDSQKIADMAARAGITVTCEFHGNTLTDTAASTLQLLNDVARDNIRTNWQVPDGASAAECAEDLAALLPWLANLHVFNWHPEAGSFLPLSGADRQWRSYLGLAASTGRVHFAMIEFVKDDSAEAFLDDARALRSWVE